MRLGDRGAGTSTKYFALAHRMRVAATSGPRGTRCARPLPCRGPEPAAAFHEAVPCSIRRPPHHPTRRLSRRDRLLLRQLTHPWTAERIEQLRNGVTSGLSCSQIAAEIGVTRNAVIGKIHRLGLSPGRPAAPARSCPPRARQPRSSPQRQFLRLMFTQAPGVAGAEAERDACRELCSAARYSTSRRANVAGRSAIRARRISPIAAIRPSRASPTAPATREWPIALRRGGALSGNVIPVRHARADRWHGACCAACRLASPF